MGEVQCFEGDGAIPPEISALMRENERLKENIAQVQRRFDSERDYNIQLTTKLRQMESKLHQIEQIINIPPIKENDGAEKAFSTLSVLLDPQRKNT